jgi:signal transduction histidine kinase
VSSLTIRVRLTLPFAVAMAAVLAATGVFIYLRVGGQLLTSVDAALDAQVQEAAARAEARRPLLDRDVNEGPTIAQVVFANGTTAESSPPGLDPLIEPSDVGAEPRRTHHITTDVEGVRGDWRLIEKPISVGNQKAMVVIGRSLAARDETLHRLGREFLFAAPGALILAILAGYLLAAAALRPVEAMRRRATAIGASTPGQRLPVPRARDEIASLAVTLNEMLARLEASFEHERRFVADASHELRTPLALLRAELELALRRPRSHAELQAAVRSAAEETERLSKLAEDLLLIARADEGQLRIRVETLAARDVLTQVRARYDRRAASAGRQIAVDAGADVVVDADPARLEQALGNLVENALLHGDGTVTLAAERRNGHVELHVRDEGAGFPAGFSGRAFDRFSRADDSRSSHGSGLGLAIVAAIAAAHGGEAHADTGLDGGADVWLKL